MRNNRLCFVTEIDLGAPLTGGGMVNDQKTISCLQKLGSVDVIYLQKLKYVPILSALLVFVFQLMRSFSRSYSVYFSRSLVASAILVAFKPVLRSKVVHQALSVPFPSDEVRYIPRDVRAKSGLSRFELSVRYVLFRFLEKNVLPRVDSITVAASGYAGELADFGVPNDRIEVVPFYVEDEFYKQPVKHGRDESFTFCYVGAFHLYHELSSLIDAFDSLCRSVNDVELLLIGDGPKRSQVENEVSSRNLAHKIRFAGSVPHYLMPSFLSKIDVFILLTHAPGLPIGVLEAAAAGKPIITVEQKENDVLSHYFKHGKAVFMVHTFSPSEISQAMEQLYRDSTLRESLANGAKETASQHFTEKATLQSLRSLLSES